MRYSVFLKENYEIFVQMLDKIKSEILIIDDRNKIVMVNYAVCRRTGSLRKDIEGMGIEELAGKSGVITSSSIKAIYNNEEKCAIRCEKSGEYHMISCIPLFYQGSVDLVIYINKSVNEIGETETPSKKNIIAKKNKYRQKIQKQNSKNELMKVPAYDTSICLGDIIDRYEKQILLQVLEECGTVTAAAHRLQVNKSTVSRKIKKYDIKL